MFSLKNPHTWFPQARSQAQRTVIAHLGPTNSGKTHAAIQELLASTKGTYCGPLRLLAQEQWDRCRTKVKMGLRTGETILSSAGESRKKYSGMPELDATHLSCTVEMADLTDTYSSMAILDEVQMMADEDRGWAFTQILLGMPTKELYVCGEAAVEPLLTTLCSQMNVKLIIRHFNRLSRLDLISSPISIDDLEPGDALITFSRRSIYDLKTLVERRKNHKDCCAVIYGGLPLEQRINQADAFNSRRVPFLIASDAIGLGLNLNIRRILFASLSKWTPTTGDQLIEPRLLRQIGGRAGRFGSTCETSGGGVGILQMYSTPLGVQFAQKSLRSLKLLWNKPIKPYKKAGLLPTDEHLLNAALKSNNLIKVLEECEDSESEHYFTCSTRPHRLTLASLGPPLLSKLDFRDQLTLARSPVRHYHPASTTILHTMTVHLTTCLPPSAFRPPSMSCYYKLDRRHKRSDQEVLADAEEVYRAIELYRWISMRFPHAFDADNVEMEAERVACSDFIKAKLECI